MKVLYVDCFSGVAGDMLLGALIDAGVPLEDVRGALGSLAIDHDTVWTERVTRAGLAATKFCVRGEEGPNAHDHEHSGSHKSQVTSRPNMRRSVTGRWRRSRISSKGRR